MAQLLRSTSLTGSTASAGAAGCGCSECSQRRRLQALIDHQGPSQEFNPATIPSDPGCVSDANLFQCFDAYKTNLRAWHALQADYLANQISNIVSRNRRVYVVLVTGHAADWRSTDPKMTLALGRARSVAEAIRSRLAALGGRLVQIPVLPLSVGDRFPVATNQNLRGRSLNRRVSVQIVSGLAPQPKKETCKPLTDPEVRALVQLLLGRDPNRAGITDQVKDVINIIWNSTNVAHDEYCRSLAGISTNPIRNIPYFTCLPALTWLDMIFTNFDQGHLTISYLKGSAYALMDAATDRTRNLKLFTQQTSAFSKGYGFVAGRINVLRSDRTIRPNLDMMLRRLACAKNQRTPLRAIYLEFFRVWDIEAPTSHSRQIKLKGDLILDYPRVEVLQRRVIPF